jgi:hypothetical protein
MNENAMDPYPYLDAVLLDFLPNWITDPTVDLRACLHYYRDLLARHPDDLAAASEYDPETPERRLAFVREFNARLPELLSSRSEEQIRGFTADVARLKADYQKLLTQVCRELDLEKMAGPLPPSPESN